MLVHGIWPFFNKENLSEIKNVFFKRILAAQQHWVTDSYTNICITSTDFCAFQQTICIRWWEASEGCRLWFSKGTFRQWAVATAATPVVSNVNAVTLETTTTETTLRETIVVILLVSEFPELYAYSITETKQINAEKFFLGQHQLQSLITQSEPVNNGYDIS